MAEENDKAALARRLQMRRVDMAINKSQSDAKKRQKEYGEILIENLRDNGQLVCFSDDRSVAELLRELVVNTLKMPASCLNISSRPENMAKIARQAITAKKAPIFLVEQNLNGRDLTFVFRVMKTAFPEIKILAFVGEADKHRFVLLHESGVDSCIVKPTDAPGLLEKIALVIKPDDQLERTLEWARTLLNQEEYLRALQVCTQAMDQNANASALLLLMGDIFRAMKEYNKAADAYAKASAGSSLFLEPLRKLADLYAETGNALKQIEYLEKMDEVSPLNLDRKIQIGELFLKLNQGEKARKMFDKAMKLSNRQARENISGVAYRVADIYIDSDPLMAASFLQRGLDARKEFWGHEDLATFNKLGLLLRRAGKWREAAGEYMKALTVAPRDENLHYNLAMAYLEGKELESARASALKAMAINPELPRKSSRIAANLGAVFVGTNDMMHALPLLRTALELDPDNAEAKEMVSNIEAAQQ